MPERLTGLASVVPRGNRRKNQLQFLRLDLESLSL